MNMNKNNFWIIRIIENEDNVERTNENKYLLKLLTDL